MTSVVFLGPTLPRERAEPLLSVLGLEIRPPAAQGDVLRALASGATRIGIVDGLFDQVPSVWHKEILWAMERGAVVYGAASMGALRAAELQRLGMIGVGRIFEMYRDGVLEDDDEVALMHGPASNGHHPISEAMVNIRDRVEAAVSAGVIEVSEAQALIAQVKALPYPQRSYRRLIELANSPSLEAFVGTPHVSLKERDALQLIERMSQAIDRPASQPVRVERTVFLERLRLEVLRECASAPVASSALAARREALLGFLAEEHASLIGVSPSEADLAEAARQLGPHATGDRVRELATLRVLGVRYQAEVERRLSAPALAEGGASPEGS